MKTKKLALAVVSMVLFSATYFSSCSSDMSAPDAASVLSQIPASSLSLNDSLVGDSLHHGRKPHHDSTAVRPPKPLHDSTCVKPPKPPRDSTLVNHKKPNLDSTIVKRPRPLFDSLAKDSIKSHRPHTYKPKGKK